MANLRLSAEVTQAERDVVLEERLSRVESRPASILSEALNAVLYQAHPYRRPTIGWRYEIERLNFEDALAFYRRWYMPNNAIVVIAGDVDPKAALALALQTYGRVPKGELPPRQTLHEPEQHAPRRVVLADPRVRQANWRRLYVAPAYEGAAPTPYALDVLAEIIGGETGRLNKSLTVDSGKAITATFWYSGDGRDYGSAGLFGIPAEGVGLEELEAGFDREIAKLLEDGGHGDGSGGREASSRRRGDLRPRQPGTAPPASSAARSPAARRSRMSKRGPIE